MTLTRTLLSAACLASVSADAAETGLLPICATDFFPSSPAKGNVISNAGDSIYASDPVISSLGSTPACANQNWRGVNGIAPTERAVIGTAVPNVIKMSAEPVTVTFSIDAAGIGAPLEAFLPPCMPAAAPMARVCDEDPGTSLFLYRIALQDGSFTGKWRAANENANGFFQMRRMEDCPPPFPDRHPVGNKGNSTPCPYEISFALDPETHQPILDRAVQVVMTNNVGGPDGLIDLFGNPTHGTTGIAIPMLFTAADSRIVQGIVSYRNGKNAGGVTISLTPNSGGTAQTTTTAGNGRFAFTGVEEGGYTLTASGDATDENGGTLSAEVDGGGLCPGIATGASCAFTHVKSTEVHFTYTQCAAKERHPNGKPPTNCPVIFLPGFLGTRILCAAPGGLEELWPNVLSPGLGPRFGEMTLNADGFTNSGEPGSCSATAVAAGTRAGVVDVVAGQDIYKSALDFLDRTVPDRWEAFPYDWRRAVTVPIDALDTAIEARRVLSGASRVVIMAHSMGGLVTRAYIDDADRADKVSRVITVGTPYWGAAKTHFALLEGDTDSPAGTPLDILTSAGDLQRFARNAFGAFWLYPSAQLGPWLSLQGVMQDAAGVDRWIAGLGATPALLDAAQAGHAQLDGFVTRGIDYEVMVGIGVPTVKQINVRNEAIIDSEFVAIGQWLDLTFASGDGTVLANSATQGIFDGKAPLKESPPLHYACRVKHVPLPGDPGVDARIERFITHGDPVEGPEVDCPFTGTEIRTFQADIKQESARIIVDGARATDPGTSLTVLEAANRGLIGYYNFGDRTTLVLDGVQPMHLEFSGRHQAIQVHTIASTGNGEWRSYAGGTTPLSIAMDGAVTRNGKVEKPAKLKGKPPRTKARIKKKRDTYLVRLKGRSPNGIAGTYYRIGAEGITQYTTVLRLNPAQLADLSFASTDAFGVTEPWQHPKKR